MIKQLCNLKKLAKKEEADASLENYHMKPVWHNKVFTALNKKNNYN